MIPYNNHGRGSSGFVDGVQKWARERRHHKCHLTCGAAGTVASVQVYLAPQLRAVKRTHRESVCFILYTCITLCGGQTHELHLQAEAKTKKAKAAAFSLFRAIPVYFTSRDPASNLALPFGTVWTLRVHTAALCRDSGPGCQPRASCHRQWHSRIGDPHRTHAGTRQQQGARFSGVRMQIWLLVPPLLSVLRNRWFYSVICHRTKGECAKHLTQFWFNYLDAVKPAHGHALHLHTLHRVDVHYGLRLHVAPNTAG